MAAIIGLAIAVPFMVLFIAVIILHAVILIKCAHSKKTAGKLREIRQGLYETPARLYETPGGLYETTGRLYESPEGLYETLGELYEENEMSVTAENEVYTSVGGIHVVQNVAYAANIPTVNTDTAEQANTDEYFNADEEYYVNADEGYVNADEEL